MSEVAADQPELVLEDTECIATYICPPFTPQDLTEHHSLAVTNETIEQYLFSWDIMSGISCTRKVPTTPTMS
jgi:hypothetical protein